MPDKKDESALSETAPPPPDDPPSDVTHTPIIITDGSAALEFTESSYMPDPDSNVNRAIDNLHLVDMVSDRPHTQGGNDFLCFAFQAGQQYEIEIKCIGNPGGFNDFKVRGSLDPQPVPEIEFDRGEYQLNAATFPPRNEHAQRFGSMGRHIRKLRIFRLVNNQRVLEHDCPLVVPPGNGWTIHDEHVEQEDEDVSSPSEVGEPQPV